MKLFGKKKKQKHVAVVETAHHKLCEMQKTRSVKKGIKILGSGCAKMYGIGKSNQNSII